MTGENLLYQCGAGAGHPDNEDRFGTAQTQVLASGEKLGRENCLGLAYDSVHGAVGRELAPDIVRLLILTEGKLRSTQVAQRLSKCKMRSEEHTSELQSLMRISYDVFCLKKKNR